MTEKSNYHHSLLYGALKRKIVRCLQQASSFNYGLLCTHANTFLIEYYTFKLRFIIPAWNLFRRRLYHRCCVFVCGCKTLFIFKEFCCIFFKISLKLQHSEIFRMNDFRVVKVTFQFNNLIFVWCRPCKANVFDTVGVIFKLRSRSNVI